jgi:hypothetical protein
MLSPEEHVEVKALEIQWDWLELPDAPTKFSGSLRALLVDAPLMHQTRVRSTTR